MMKKRSLLLVLQEKGRGESLSGTTIPMTILTSTPAWTSASAPTILMTILMTIPMTMLQRRTPLTPSSAQLSTVLIGTSTSGDKCPPSTEANPMTMLVLTLSFCCFAYKCVDDTCRNAGCRCRSVDVGKVPTAKRRRGQEDLLSLDLEFSSAKVITSHMENFVTSFSTVQQEALAAWSHDQARNMCNVYFLWPSGMQMCQPYFCTQDDTS